jgi:hypothetical protein
VGKDVLSYRTTYFDHIYFGPVSIQLVVFALNLTVSGTLSELHALFFDLGEQLLGKLLLIHIDRHRFQCFGHHQSFPPSSRPACQTKTRSTVIQTVPAQTYPAAARR